MQNVFCSFIGKADAEFLFNEDIKTGRTGPMLFILNSLISRRIEFNRIIIFNDLGNDIIRLKSMLKKHVLAARIDIIEIKPGKNYNASNYNVLYKIIDTELIKYKNKPWKWYFNLSSGTPAMSSMLLIYAMNNFDLNAEFYQSFFNKKIGKEVLEKAEIPFSINLKEINQYISEKTYSEVVGNSPELKFALNQAEQVAYFDVNCFIYGESGTGKELIANEIIFKSHRKKSGTVNCAVLSAELAESILFGHVKGSFTGAVSDKAGIFEENNNGIVFLDEIGDLKLEIQAKLLRALQEKKIRRLGGKKETDIDVVVIAATNKNIPEMIKDNTFREDLYYRLATVEVHLPPLRNRKEDIPLLIEDKMQKINEQFKALPKIQYQDHTITEDAVNLIAGFEFPGNIRQLEHLLKRLCMQTDKNIIDVEDVKKYYNNSRLNFRTSLPELPLNLEKYIKNFKLSMFHKAMLEAKNVKKKAAESLGMRDDTFNKAMKKLKRDNIEE